MSRPNSKKHSGNKIEIKIEITYAFSNRIPVWEPGRSAIKLRFPLLAMAVAMLLDLDHFAAAHSFSISDAISIEAYPGTHSLTMAVIFPSIIYVWKHNFRVTWIVFLALLSHVIRDAGLWGVPLFFPFSSTIKLPYGLYLLVILALQQTIFYERRQHVRHFLQLCK